MNNKRWAGRAILVALGISACVSSTSASQHRQPTKPAVQTHQKLVAYQTDGTPIATGAPRRLSALAMGGSAWTAYHETRGRKHRQQVANKQPPAVR